MENLPAALHEATTLNAHIGPESFPLPDRADTFVRPLNDADQMELDERLGFATLQSEAANGALTVLNTCATPTAETWASLYASLTQWRSGLAVARFERGVVHSRDRITLPITDASPNCDRIGRFGRLLAGSVWSDEAQAYVDGIPTPASRIMEAAGERARERFIAEDIPGDELQNMVRLPDGSVVCGNRIVKGHAARAVALELKRRVEARGHDVSQFETGVDDIMFTITANEAGRRTIFQSAMQELASQKSQECTPETWANIAYLLYQSPQYKRGSDAVIRTYLVAAGAYLLGSAPVLPQDIDLRAYTMSQNDFVSYLLSTS